MINPSIRDSQILYMHTHLPAERKISKEFWSTFTVNWINFLPHILFHLLSGHVTLIGRIITRIKAAGEFRIHVLFHHHGNDIPNSSYTQHRKQYCQVFFFYCGQYLVSRNTIGQKKKNASSSVV